MKLTRQEYQVEGEKRQHFPYSIEAKCTECGKTKTLDFTCYDYISHPLFGQEEILSFACYECGHEDEIRLRTNITLELINGGNDEKEESRGSGE